MAIDDLALIARSIERALVRIADATIRGDRVRPGRKPRVVGEQCRLFLVGWRRGSAVATFEAGRPDELFNEVAARPLELLMEGLSRADDWTRDDPHWRSFAPAIGELRELGSVFGRGIERIDLRRPDRAGPPVSYDKALHERLSALYATEPETRRIVVTGRLDRLDGHAGLAGTLWEDDGTTWACRFPNALEVHLARYWMRRVRVEGVGRTPTRRGPRILRVESIEPEDLPLEEATRRFWTATSLSNLAREQAVAPITDVEELRAVWGEERLETDPFEELMAERRRRRETADIR
ncbi:MAG: hypothetical protein N2038_14280 [Geminicoccaceae bacterium]|nr:hypothetical protein [Geminicoccaceae bacterium]